MWPFYIIALHRILEAAGHHDELDHRLEMLDSLPWPRVDGDGLTGSVFPLTRALVALSAGLGAEAQDHLTRADQRLTYTKVVTAAANVTAGRLTRALEQAYDLRKETRGFRLLEIRRLSVVAAAQYLSGDNHGCTETLSRATALPRGLTPPETLLFGAELHEFAEQHLGSWPRHSTGKPIFFITASETRPYTHSPRRPDPRTPDPGALTGQNRRKTVYQSEYGQDSITVNLPEIRGIFGSRSYCRGRTPWP